MNLDNTAEKIEKGSIAVATGIANYARKLWKAMKPVPGIPEVWEIEKSRAYTTTHSRTYQNGDSYDKRKVKTVCVIEKEKNSGKRRGRVIYGTGTLFDDQHIDILRAEMKIKGDI